MSAAVGDKEIPGRVSFESAWGDGRLLSGNILPVEGRAVPHKGFDRPRSVHAAHTTVRVVAQIEVPRTVHPEAPDVTEPREKGRTAVPVVPRGPRSRDGGNDVPGVYSPDSMVKEVPDVEVAVGIQFERYGNLELGAGRGTAIAVEAVRPGDSRKGRDDSSGIDPSHDG
jgi:hypothetical protein